MFHLELFRIRAFAAGNLAALLAAMGRGGLQFILIIWLQGIWLPRARLRLLADAALGRHLHAAADRRASSSPAPASGWLSDRFGARPFATGGMLVAALSFVPPDRAAGELLVRLVRADPAAERDRHGPLRVAEQRRRDELAAADAARRRRRDARHVHELGQRALDRRLLHADDRRARRPACRTRCRPAWSRTACPPPTPPASRTCRRSRRCSRRSSATTRWRRCSARTCCTRCRRRRRHVLTGRSFFPHLISKPFHTALVYAFVLRDRRLPRRRGRLAAARRQVPPRGGEPAGGPRPSSRRWRRQVA